VSRPRNRRQPPRPRVRLSRSAEETTALGRQLGRGLRAGSVVLLRGSLGTGKTTLARGLATGLGVDDPTVVASPSFTLVNTYRGRLPIHHVDLYRVEGGSELDSIGIDEFLGCDGVTIVEWAERLPGGVAATLDIELEDAGGDLRRIRVGRPGAARATSATGATTRRRRRQ